MNSLPLTIAAAVGGLSLLAVMVALVAKRLRLFRAEKATMQMRAIPHRSVPKNPSQGAVAAGPEPGAGLPTGPVKPRLRETSVPAWAARIIDLKTSAVTIGRSLDSDIVLVEDAASAEHCRIERKGESFRLVDLGSTNKTWVNGHKIKTTDLRHGDEIRAGQTKFVFEWVAAGE